MNIEYDLQKLDNALYDFYCVTGVSITFYDAALKPITQRSTRPAGYCRMIAARKDGALACDASNKAVMRTCLERGEPVRHVCAAGLTDIAIPLVHADGVLGYLMLGQIRMSEEFPDIKFACREDRKELEMLYREIPLQSEEKVTAIMHVAEMLTKHILLENMIKPRHKRAADAITNYIVAHLTERLSVEKIAKNVFLSQSGIYKAMDAKYGCTVSEYISHKRVEQSLPLLEESERSIEDIALAVGFSSVAYYSRVFKKQMGASPLQYRNEKRRI